MLALVQSTAARAVSEKLEASIPPVTARSWLPISETAQRSRTSAVHSAGWAP